MAVQQVFDGYDFRTNDGRNSTEFFFNGHLTVDQIAETYYAAHPEHRTEYPYAVGPGSIRHAWHLFTLHEDTCYLIAEADPGQPFEPDEFFDPILCSCAAAASLDDDPSRHHRHPHPAAPGQPGAVPVTWVTIHPA
jgi:hypothetical protein